MKIINIIKNWVIGNLSYKKNNDFNKKSIINSNMLKSNLNFNNENQEIKIIKPLVYGTWLLRTTNDLNIDNQINYLTINNDNTIKFKSLDSNYILGIKQSRTAEYKIVNQTNDTFNIHFRYLKKNTYTYSFLGIEIPEIKTKTEIYKNDKNLTLNLYNNILLIYDNDETKYYTFDLVYGKIKYPNTETQVYTFMFTQLFGITINTIINKLLE